MQTKLKTKLEELNITAYRLAKITGITTTDVYALKNGKKPAFEGWKKRISEALGIPINELFEEDPAAEEASRKGN